MVLFLRIFWTSFQIQHWFSSSDHKIWFASAFQFSNDFLNPLESEVRFAWITVNLVASEFTTNQILAEIYASKLISHRSCILNPSEFFPSSKCLKLTKSHNKLSFYFFRNILIFLKLSCWNDWKFSRHYCHFFFLKKLFTRKKSYQIKGLPYFGRNLANLN